MTTREALPLSTHSEDGAKLRDGCSREVAKMGRAGIPQNLRSSRVQFIKLSLGA
mgnify:CR=1